VVHTDSSDNIICVYRGHKTFIMVDPSLYTDKVSRSSPYVLVHIDVDLSKLVQTALYTLVDL